ncbi:uncharacterized protein NDAI_0B00380 [Naumovozyma dairenensis CBS 421]|uniref:Uncharacterized protein n=1 Tax=Naumovozyma dairenensis (strain ATCC 10597 / BCRC 20456 / CBS 421 / NBRC 0211 / NRRL Y-12639) TaxID=1071378 RepID=G0W5L1_NAUDC|nr:hypothetical protein NDAI_0B00380 [Naumovozyma dairenensis CBS 421]CCD23072.1 hypothetical protein NDAI_0B00380 [Naumovozyma dairenensis CBS 421]
MSFFNQPSRQGIKGTPFQQVSENGSGTDTIIREESFILPLEEEQEFIINNPSRNTSHFLIIDNNSPKIDTLSTDSEESITGIISARTSEEFSILSSSAQSPELKYNKELDTIENVLKENEEKTSLEAVPLHGYHFLDTEENNKNLRSILTQEQLTLLNKFRTELYSLLKRSRRKNDHQSPNRKYPDIPSLFSNRHLILKCSILLFHDQQRQFISCNKREPFINNYLYSSSLSTVSLGE